MASGAKVTAIAEHLEYELKMLWATGAELLTATPGTWAQKNALVEAFALHTRNLVDFFYTPATGDDVVAQHFFGQAGRWNAVRPPLSTTLKTSKARANKEISHLTYGRLKVTTQAKHWPVRPIISELEAVLAVFLDRADKLPDKVKLLRYKNLLP
jgi:hypothetical protein